MRADGAAVDSRSANDWHYRQTLTAAIPSLAWVPIDHIFVQPTPSYQEEQGTRGIKRRHDDHC